MSQEDREGQEVEGDREKGQGEATQTEPQRSNVEVDEQAGADAAEQAS
jgi:hypothetical protein